MKHTYQLDLNQRRIYYLDEGQGQTVLLLHGNGASAEMYHRMIDALSPNHRVLVPDLPGYGRSQARYPLRLDSYLSELETFINHHVDGPLLLIGHSLGGMIAYNLMLRKRIPAVERAVWMEAAIFNLDWRLQMILPGYAFWHSSKPHRRENVEAKMRAWCWDYDNGDKISSEGFLKTYLQSDRKVHGMFFAAAPSMLPYRFKQIETPVLCIRGAKDHFISAATDWIAPQLPNSRHLVIPQSGHFLVGENDAALNQAILDFFAEGQSAQRADLADQTRQTA